MRCLALADALRRRGEIVKFICRRIPTRMYELAHSKGHTVTLLDSAICSDTDELAHSHWLGTSQHTDAELTIDAINGKTVQWLIVDHYGLDARWESVQRESAENILAIDDLADRAHECDALLDQNLHEEMQARYSVRVPPGCALLLGPKYALLREEFRKARPSMRVRDGGVRRILILMGGVDADKLTLRAIDAVSSLSHSVEVDVVISLQNPAREEIREACERNDYAMHVQPPNIAEFMVSADLSIGSAGSTSWERCCLGLPTICITEASNQEPIAAALDAAGAIVNLGDKAQVGVPDIVASLTVLIEQRDRLKSMSSNASMLVDGMGADRVADVMSRSA